MKGAEKGYAEFYDHGGEEKPTSLPIEVVVTTSNATRERHPLALNAMPDYARNINFSPLTRLARETGRAFVVFDLETTTFVHAPGFGIVEFGMVVADLAGRIGCASTLLDAGLPIHPAVSQKIGITRRDLIGKPKFPDIADRIRGIFTRSTVSGFHSKTFDIPGVAKECRRYGLEAIEPAAAKDLRELVKMIGISPKSYKLVDVAHALGVLPDGTAHRAQFDAVITAAVAAKILEKIGTQKFMDTAVMALPMTAIA